MSEERQTRMSELRTELAILEAEERAEEQQRASKSLEDYHRERDERYAREIGSPDSAYFALNPRPQGDVRPYVLPFGREYGKWNPRDVEHHPFGQEWLGHTLALICKRLDQDRSRPTRLIHTSGGPLPSPGDQIGERFEARHDQTNARLGFYEIAGIVVYAPDGSVARIVGDVPDVKFSLSTYK